MAPTSNASKTWILRARQTVLILVLFACASSLESLPPAQSDSLTVLFKPRAQERSSAAKLLLSVSRGETRDKVP